MVDYHTRVRRQGSYNEMIKKGLKPKDTINKANIVRYVNYKLKRLNSGIFQ